MTTPLHDAVAGLASTLASSAGRSVTYRRGSTPAVVTAVPTQRTYDVDTGHGVVELVESHDWLIVAAVLGALGLPQAGDRIEDAFGGTTYTYEVRGPGGMAPWQWCDPHRVTVRVHSVLVNEA